MATTANQARAGAGNVMGYPPGSPEDIAQKQAAAAAGNPIPPPNPAHDQVPVDPNAYVDPYAGYANGSPGSAGGGTNWTTASASGGGSGTVGGLAGPGTPLPGGGGKASTNPMAGVSSALGAIPGVGGIAGGVASTIGDALVAPNTYDANGNLTLSTQAAGNIYNRAMQPVANAPTANITSRDVAAPTINAQTIATPNAIQAQNVATPGAIQAQTVAAPGAITAQNVSAPADINAQSVQASDLLQGGTADAQRAAILQQAQTAANSPSSAAAAMRAAGNQIENQQAGLAAQARGADRASARRDAMLATGTQGMTAASTTAQLAAQEQAAKQQAYTSALTGVRAGDVSASQALAGIGEANQGANLSGQQWTAANALAAATANQQANLTGQIQTGAQGLTAATANQAANLQAQTTTGAQALTAGTANQAANLQAQTTTGAQNIQVGTANAANNLTGQVQQGSLGVQAGTANQQANLTAQQADIANKQTGYVDTQNAQNAKLQTATQAVGATNQAQGVAATYGTGQNAQKSKTAGSLVSAASGLLSYERAKTDVAPIGDTDLSMGTEPTGWQRAGAAMQMMGDRLSDAPPAQIAPIGKKQDFLDWRMPQPPPDTSSTSSTTGIGGLLSGLGVGLSDVQAKRDVERMDPRDVVDWAESVPTATWRYRKGVPGTDQGADYHAGTIAQGLERTGPLGKLLVHRDPQTGLKQVEYGPLGLMVGKGALTKADQALNWAKAAYSMAARKGS